MADKSGIQWTNATWNPWQGCTPKSEGCANCYMYSQKRRWGQDPTTIVRSSKATFYAPLKKLKGPLVFTCSWSDFFIENADEWRPEAWEIIAKTPHLTYQILTKRPELVQKRLPEDWGDGYPNVWLGVTTENQERADERIPLLVDIPAKVRFISAEPLLEEINLQDYLSIDSYYDNQIDWIIAGGESGSKHRECKASWIRSLRDQSLSFKVPFFFKQWGGHTSKANGRLLDDVEHSDFPAIFQAQQYLSTCPDNV